MSKFRTYLQLVTFSHSVFALPFALLSMIVAAKGLPESRIIILIIVSMISARTAAMAFNRFADAKIDALNPRTKSRHLPSGKISKTEVLIIIIMSSIIFVTAAYLLNSLCFILSPIALVIILLYSYSKRFTYLSHIWLGISLGIAPIGSWIAVTGEFGIPSFLLGFAVIFWVAGFDVIYSVQDFNFDKKTGLHSLVVKLGIQKALNLSGAFHFLTVILFFIFSKVSPVGLLFMIALSMTAALLVYEHFLVRIHLTDKINIAFFTINGIISVLLLLAGSIDISSGLV